MENQKQKNNKVAIIILSIICIISIIFSALVLTGKITLAKEDEKENQKTIVVENNGKQTVTTVDVKCELNKINEIYVEKATINSYYQTTKNAKVFGKKIKSDKLTSNITYVYDAIVKVGYNLDDVDPEIIGNQIIIKLPAKANTIVELSYDEKDVHVSDHFYNRITAKDVIEYEKEMKKESIAFAKEKGIYAEAKQTLKDNIMKHFKCFEELGYEIVIM